VAEIKANASLLSSNFNPKNNLCFTQILDKFLEDRNATLHTFGKPILQISRILK